MFVINSIRSLGKLFYWKGFDFSPSRVAYSLRVREDEGCPHYPVPAAARSGRGGMLCFARRGACSGHSGECRRWGSA